MEQRAAARDADERDPHRSAAKALARELAARGAGGRAFAIVLGSGLGAIADGLEERRAIPGVELEHLPRARVKGHDGAVVLGELGGVPVIVLSGRVHLYEGRSPFEVTLAVRALALLGVQVLVLTNAAGGLVPGWEPGTLMRIVDHINLQGRSPLYAAEASRASPYDDALGTLLEEAARERRVTLERGVYAGMLGPAYETPAEIRALRDLGAHAVGMSTVAEAAAAHAAGLRVVALSCIANPAAGLGAQPLEHEDVLAAMRRSANRLRVVLAQALPAWARALAGREKPSRA